MVKRVLYCGIAGCACLLCILVFRTPTCSWEFRCVGEEQKESLGCYSGPSLVVHGIIEDFLRRKAYDQSRIEYLQGREGVVMRVTIGARDKALARERIVELRSSTESAINTQFECIQAKWLLSVKEEIKKRRLVGCEAEELLHKLDEDIKKEKIVLETLYIGE